MPASFMPPKQKMPMAPSKRTSAILPKNSPATPGKRMSPPPAEGSPAEEAMDAQQAKQAKGALPPGFRNGGKIVAKKAAAKKGR